MGTTVKIGCGQFSARMAKDVAEALRHVAKDVFDSGSSQRDWLRRVAGQLDGQLGCRDLEVSGEPRELAEVVKAVEHVAREVFEDGEPQCRTLSAFAAGLREALAVTPPAKLPVDLSAADRTLIRDTAAAQLAISQEHDRLTTRATPGVVEPLKRSGDPILAIQAEEALHAKSRLRSVIALSMRNFWPGRSEEVRRLRLDRAANLGKVTLPADLAAHISGHNAEWEALNARSVALDGDSQRAVARIGTLVDAEVVEALLAGLPGGARPSTPTPIHLACHNRARSIREQDAEARTSPLLRR